MRFLNKRDEFNVIFSKEDAIKELLQDTRIDRIEKYYNGMVIYTIPVIPDYNKKNTKIKYRRNFYLAPIGTYKILILDLDGRLIIQPVRLEGVVKCHILQYHINSQDNRSPWYDGLLSKTCWGNVSESIDYVKHRKDWYWAGKISLDLLYDGNPELTDHTELRFYELQLYLQYDYALKNKLAIAEEIKRRYEKTIEYPIDDGGFHNRDVI